jgi:hypothetical protein
VNNLIEDLLGGGSLIADTTRDVDDALAAPVGTATTKSV